MHAFSIFDPHGPHHLVLPCNFSTASQAGQGALGAGALLKTHQVALVPAEGAVGVLLGASVRLLDGGIVVIASGQLLLDLLQGLLDGLCQDVIGPQVGGADVVGTAQESYCLRLTLLTATGLQ